jgi:hypothetical protein
MRAGTLLTCYLVALFFFHQDFWLKDNPKLVFGILPATLAYHMFFTVLAVLGWAAVVKFAWPAGLDDDDSPEGGTRK